MSFWKNIFPSVKAQEEATEDELVDQKTELKVTREMIFLY